MMSENCLNVYAFEMKLILSCVLLTKSLEIKIFIEDFLNFKEILMNLIIEENFNLYLKVMIKYKYHI